MGVLSLSANAIVDGALHKGEEWNRGGGPIEKLGYPTPLRSRTATDCVCGFEIAHSELARASHKCNLATIALQDFLNPILARSRIDFFHVSTL